MLTGAIIILAMRLICALISVAALGGQAQTLPPPFPRPNAVKLLDNDRAQVWNVVWPKSQPTALHRHIYDVTGVYTEPGDRQITALDGSTRQVSTAAGGIVWQFKGLTHMGRAIFLRAGTEHTSEPISAGAKATIFELK